MTRGRAVGARADTYTGLHLNNTAVAPSRARGRQHFNRAYWAEKGELRKKREARAKKKGELEEADAAYESHHHYHSI